MTPTLRSEIAEIQEKAKLYINLGRYDAAEKLLKSLLIEYGSLANIHNTLGITYHCQSKFSEAIVEFNRALASNPEFIEAALNLAATLCDVSRYDDASTIFELINNPQGGNKKQPQLVLGRIANHHVACANAYEEAGMLNDAIQEFRRALSLFDRMSDVRLSLAKLYVRVGQLEKAKTELEELIKRDKGNSPAHTWLGLLYLKLGRKELAQNHWEEAQKIDEHNLAAKAYLKMIETGLFKGDLGSPKVQAHFA